MQDSLFSGPVQHRTAGVQTVDSAETRRTFVKKMAAGTAALAAGSAMQLSSTANAMPASSYERILGSNERIALGFIGMGRMSRGHLRNRGRG